MEGTRRYRFQLFTFYQVLASDNNLVVLRDHVEEQSRSAILLMSDINIFMNLICLDSLAI